MYVYDVRRIFMSRGGNYDLQGKKQEMCAIFSKITEAFSHSVVQKRKKAIAIYDIFVYNKAIP